MFRAQQNAFDDAVAKATDENLTSENWEFILDVCDKANAQDTGPKDVVASMIKRLAHRNANVQLYTLELANALSENCGLTLHQELASRSFTDALLRLANDRNTHQQVKAKILECMSKWAEMFSQNPDLGIMDQAYNKLKSQNPNLHPPSKPTKRQITDADREKEEKELQLALELSIKGERSQSVSDPSESSTKGTVPTTTEASAQPVSVSPGTTAATVSRVRALYDFQPSEPGELQFKTGDIIAVLESVYKDWWKGSLRGQTGIFPLNYVEKLSDPTQEERQREALMEAEVFAEIKNVEKLLTLLSTSTSEPNVRDNDEITKLYHSTLAIRPKLIELIGKYSQRKDDFTQLNEKFIKARRDYESLLEASMSQPPQQTYGRPGQNPYGYSGGYPPQGPPAQHELPQTYPNPQDSRTPQPYNNPPQNAPMPFHVSGQINPQQPHQQQQPQQQPQYPPQQQPQYPPQDRRMRTPSGPRPGPPSDPYNHRPQSTYDNPQELGTSSYSSPTDSGPHSYPAQYQPQLTSQNNDYSPSTYPAEESQSPIGQAPQQPTYPPPQQPYPSGPPAQPNYPPAQPNYPPPAQPSYQPPKVPSPSNLQSPYPVLNARPPPGTYQAYQPPKIQQQQPPPQPYAGVPSNNPQDYYR